jgi:hypothetical protein
VAGCGAFTLTLPRAHDLASTRPAAAASHTFPFLQAILELQRAALKEGEELDVAKMREKVQMEYAGTDKGQRIIEQYELLTTQAPPRRTKADKENNRRSLNRKLDQRYGLVWVVWVGQGCGYVEGWVKAVGAGR